MLTLGIETASDVCAVAVVRDGQPVVDLAVLAARSHATRLAPLVGEALAHAGSRPADLDAIAVSAGPGSYTGLRIGLSLAKGLCLTTGASLVAVPTLDAFADAALDVADAGDAVVVAARSRRGEIYGAAFERRSGELVETRPSAPVALADLPAWCPSAARTWVLGEAADAVLDVLGASARRVRTRASALPVALRGAEQAAAGQTVDVAGFEPEYLKPFEATQPRAIFPQAP